MKYPFHIYIFAKTKRKSNTRSFKKISNSKFVQHIPPSRPVQLFELSVELHPRLYGHGQRERVKPEGTDY